MLSPVASDIMGCPSWSTTFSASLPAFAIFFAFNHFIPRENGIAVHTMASETIKVRVMAVFYIDRNVSSSAAVGARSWSSVAPAATTAAAETSGSCRGTPLKTVLMVIVWPIAIAMALNIISNRRHRNKRKLTRLVAMKRLPQLKIISFWKFHNARSMKLPFAMGTSSGLPMLLVMIGTIIWNSPNGNLNCRIW